VVGRLRQIALAILPHQGAVVHAADYDGILRDLIRRHFLFTLVGLLAHGDRLATFSLGDGVLIVNEECLSLGPFPGNMPPYLGYQLFPDVPEGNFRFRIHHEMPLESVDSVVLGSDGVEDFSRLPHPHGDLKRFWTDPRYLKNPDMIRRTLRIIQRRPQGPWLSDDTTLVVLRRKEGMQ
jgi:hypothetical protein